MAILNGKPGILKVVADYVVGGTPQHVRTLRQLMDRLPAFIKDIPFRGREEEGEEEDEDEIPVIPPPQNRFIDDDDIEE